MTTLTLLLLSTKPAFATDADADGYDPGATFPDTADCDDADAAVSPADQEVVGDLVDQDCDGHDAARRDYHIHHFPSSHWTLTSATSSSADDILEISANGSAVHNTNVANTTGGVHVAVMVLDKSGSDCTVALRADTPGGPNVTDTQSLTGVGLNVLTFSGIPAPTRTFNRFTLACPASSTVEVDWLILQNVDDVVLPPAPELSATWRDINTTDGGYITGTTRAFSPYLGETVLVSGSDNAGVGIKYVDDGLAWRRANGFEDEGVTDLSVWDVAAVEFDGDSGSFEIFALSGELYGGEVHGGLWHSPDEGETWTLLGDALHDGIAMAGRLGECTGTVLDKDIAAGQFLVADDESWNGTTPDADSFLWIASNYKHRYFDLNTSTSWEYEFKVHGYSELEGLCEETVDTLPSNQYIGAIARAEGSAPYLVVGYRSGQYTSPDTIGPESVYVCELPYNTADGEPWVSCADLTTLSCTAVAGSDGIDVSDIEVDPLDPDILYISDGGDDPDSSSLTSGCQGALGGTVHVLDLSGSSPSISDIGDSSWPGDFYGVTGVSMDPAGDYLFAFLAGDEDNWGTSPIWRVPRADIYTGPWEQVLGPGSSPPAPNAADQDAHFAATDYSGSWWVADTQMTPLPYPEVYTPVAPVDATWYEDCSGSCEYHAVVMTRKDMWDVTGLTTATDLWADTDWVKWPEYDTGYDFDYEAMGGREMAVDHDRNLWVVSQDNGMYMMPAPTLTSLPPAIDEEFPAERDCLFELYGSGGTSVAVGAYDGAIWGALHDQDGSAVPHNIGVFRALPDDTDADTDGELWEWTYQGAGVSTSHASRDSNYSVRCRVKPVTGMRSSPVPADHLAFPMDGLGGGYAFAYDPSAPTVPDRDPTGYSFGNARSVRALDEHIALMAFTSYDAGPTNVNGRLTYTLDGGATWEPVVYDTTPGSCDEYEFFENLLTTSLVGVGSDTYWEDADSDGVVDASTDPWQIDVLVASNYQLTSGGAVGTDNCALARVVIDASGSTWEWIPVPHRTADLTTNCRVSGISMTDMEASPWSDEVFITGSYLRSGSSEWGGACSVSLTSPYTSYAIASPMGSEGTYELEFAAVAPDPYVKSSVMLSTYVSLSSNGECTEPYRTYASDTNPSNDIANTCPRNGSPYWANGSGSLWDVTRIPGAPAGLVAGPIAWVNYPVDYTDTPHFYQGSSSGGIWQVRLD